MTDKDAIDMLKEALDKANVPNAPASDFDHAVLVIVGVNGNMKDNNVQSDAIFSALEAEIKQFVNSPNLLERAKGTLPTSDVVSFLEFCTNFLLFNLHEIDPLKL